jgi:capsular polysaccharide biosynthesis protein
MSFGRQCSAIGPAGKAVRETGFYLDGEVQTSKIPVSPLSLRYWRKRWASDVTSRPWLPPKQRIAGRVAVLNARYSHNYFHWLIEILPRVMPLRRAGLSADFYLVDCLSPFQQTALAALGIDRHQLIQPHCKLLLEAEELIVPSFPSPACLREFGRTMLAGLGSDAAVTARRRIFISRRKTGTRTLANELQLEQMLKAHWFETHSLEDYPLAKQARLIHEAEIVVATHGAGLANLVFARPGTCVVEIVPVGRFNYACYPKRTRLLGLHHQLVFADCPGRRQVLHVALDDVAAALDEAEAVVPQSAAA